MASLLEKFCKYCGAPLGLGRKPEEECSSAPTPTPEQLVERKVAGAHNENWSYEFDNPKMFNELKCHCGHVTCKDCFPRQKNTWEDGDPVHEQKDDVKDKDVEKKIFDILNLRYVGDMEQVKRELHALVDLARKA